MINIVLLNGKELSCIIKDELREIVSRRRSDGKSEIVLSIIQVGDDPASSVYVRNKVRACEYVGIKIRTYHFPEFVSQYELVSQISKLNQDGEVTGILVQLPLPKHINEREVTSAISVEKDVDGFHEINIGRLCSGDHCILPCTPAGIIELLKYYGINISGKECVVVGRSNIVGKPAAMLLLQNDGTVTLCHSKTSDLKSVCRRADILVCAIGSPKFFTNEYVKDGAVVIDVGIHRLSDGSLCGDVDFDDVATAASAVTPVPGGVGAMTVAMLMRNCVELADRNNNKQIGVY